MKSRILFVLSLAVFFNPLSAMSIEMSGRDHGSKVLCTKAIDKRFESPLSADRPVPGFSVSKDAAAAISAKGITLKSASGN